MKVKELVKILQDIMSIYGEEIRGLESELENTNADMELYKKKSENITKFLNDLYEGIDENYIEALRRNDELVIARADAQLQLIKEIIDRVEEI
jgi:hypothetical protein|nr:MAG TPA: hypothetical protein [Caudoviricetes sp.]